MPSEIDICNLALTKLGQQRIIALTDNVKAARSLNAIYALERDNELRAHIWNFATTRALLPALIAPPAFGFNIAYQLPDDELAVIQAGLFPPGSRRGWWWGGVGEGSDYKIEGRTIVTNLPAPLQLRYTSRVTDPNLFDASFIKAFASRLVMEVAEDLTQSSGKRQLAQGEYKEAIVSAIRANAVELPPDEMPPNSWLQSRLPG